MSAKDNLNEALAKLGEMSSLAQRIQTLSTEYDAHMKLWELSIRNANGQEEGKERALLHTLLDRLLDERARSLQLVSEVMALKPPHFP